MIKYNDVAFLAGFFPHDWSRWFNPVPNVKTGYNRVYRHPCPTSFHLFLGTDDAKLFTLWCKSVHRTTPSKVLQHTWLPPSGRRAFPLCYRLNPEPTLMAKSGYRTKSFFFESGKATKDVQGSPCSWPGSEIELLMLLHIPHHVSRTKMTTQRVHS